MTPTPPTETEAALLARIAELERRLAQQTAQFEVTNRELDAFSYSVAHDLRAPLRALDGFSSKLRHLHGADLSAEGNRYLAVIHRNAQQMGQLIDGLLAVSRLTRQPLQEQDVAPRSLVDLALEDVRDEREGRQVDIRIGDLVPCRADPRLLQQVFRQLLSNALKFTRGRDSALIEIGCTREHGAPIYHVKDNGVGFDMRYADKLFGVFHRLHRVDQFEGTGIGLAIAERIVQRHGGRIWAEAALDRGATFFFTLSASASNGA